jgi:hypothetical protein
MARHRYSIEIYEDSSTFGEVDQHPRRVTAANLPPNGQSRIFTEDVFHCGLQDVRRLQLWVEASSPCDVSVRWVNGWRAESNGSNVSSALCDLASPAAHRSADLL